MLIEREKYNDERVQEWVKEVQETGNDKAFDSLYKEFSYLLYAVVSRQSRRWPEPFEHLKNDILSVFYELVIKYDESRTKTFRKYISSALFWYVENLRNKMFPVKTLSIPSYEQKTSLAEKPVLRRILSEEFLEEVFGYVKRNFSSLKCPLYYKIFHSYYFNGLTQLEVARNLGCSQTFVSLSLKEMREKIQSEGFWRREF